MSLSNGNQSIDLHSKPMDWFLDDSDIRHERVKPTISYNLRFYQYLIWHQNRKQKMILINFVYILINIIFKILVANFVLHVLIIT